MSDIIEPGLVMLDADLGPDKSGVIRALAARVAESGRATDADALFADAWKREEQAPTGLPGGLAIPHAKSPAVKQASLAIARLARPVEFDEGEDADLVFLIAAPDTAAQDHLALLSTLARSLMRDDFVASLRSAATPDEVVGIVQGALAADDDEAEADEAHAAGAAAPVVASAATAGATPADGDATSARRSIVAVTACPTGIAHTYMAADALAAAAERAGVDYHVETQGSSGAKPLDPAVIAAADAVIFAVDVDVRDKGRFAGKPVVQAPVKRGIDEPDELIAKALAAASDPNAARVPAGGDGAGATAAVAGGRSFGSDLKRWLLTGVSYMIPFVAAGGLIVALAFLIGGYEIGENAGEIVLNNALWNLPPGGLSEYIGSVLIVIGSASMAFLVPALSGYIAYAMADRPGIAPGFVAGSVALILNAGFLGGLVGGLLAGAAAMWLGRLRPPRWLRGLMPVVIIPLLASLFSSGLLLLILGAPIATLMMWLTDWLNSLTGVSAIALGAILGLMMGFDLGGPVNKVAYAFAVTGLAAGSLENQAPWQIMAAVMAAGMVPPLGMAFASTVLARRLFTEPERENGVAAWLLGLSFISEGAIPFAAADPLRVIASSMVGGATAGAICMAAGVTSQAPHGGIFVFFAIGNFGMFLLAILVGTLVMGFMVVALKRWARRSVPVDETGPVPAGAAVAAA